jgi:hypothetical protein
MDLAGRAGFNAIRLTAQWSPGLTAPRSGDLERLENAVEAAALDGIEVLLSVYPYGSSATPPRSPVSCHASVDSSSATSRI